MSYWVYLKYSVNKPAVRSSSFSVISIDDDTGDLETIIDSAVHKLSQHLKVRRDDLNICRNYTFITTAPH